MEPQLRAQKIEEAVDDQLSKDLGDHFNFQVRQALPIGDMNPENLAAIVLVLANIGVKEFCKIRIDVGVSDRERLPGEHVSGRNLLAFAGVKSPDILVRAREEIFADKLLAYTGQGETGMRWRDLVDMQLLIDKGLNKAKLLRAMETVEVREGKLYPTELCSPPRHWAHEYAETAEKCKLPISLEQAFEDLNKYAEPLLDRYRKLRL